MGRFLAGAAAAFLLLTGAFLIWKGRAEQSAVIAAAVPAQASEIPGRALAPIPEAPLADPKTKEEKRFARADKDEDGRITLAELVEPRRKPFAKLDVNGDGTLSFEEWAVKTIDKFEKADADKGYDFPKCRDACKRRHIKHRIARRGIESKERLGRHRWVIERTFAWLTRYRRLTVRYERLPAMHHAFLHLACAMICFKFLTKF